MEKRWIVSWVDSLDIETKQDIRFREAVESQSREKEKERGNGVAGWVKVAGLRH